MNKSICSLLMFLCFWATTAVYAEGDPIRGKDLYILCSSCHGLKAEGNQQMNGPPLNGLPEWYISRQLINFREGIRGTDEKDIYGLQMRPMALVLPDQQAVQDVTAYITTLKK